MTKTVTKTKAKAKANTQPKAKPKAGASSRLTMTGRIRTQSDIPIPRKTTTYMAAMAGISNATYPGVAKTSDAIFTRTSRRLTYGAMWVASCRNRKGIQRRDVLLAAQLMGMN